MSWNAVSGDWSVPGNWSPGQVPNSTDEAVIGILPIAENAWVSLDQNETIADLTITDGMVLQTLEFSMNVTGNTSVSGLNESPDFIIHPSRLRVNQGPALEDFRTTGLTVTDEASVEIQDGAWLRANGRFIVADGSAIRGYGVIDLHKDGPFLSALSLNGHLQVTSGGMEIYQHGTSRVDLDGASNAGSVSIGSLAEAPDVLTIFGSALHDAFDGTILIGGENRLAMNLTEGWELGSGGRISLLGGEGNLAVVQGTPLSAR